MPADPRTDDGLHDQLAAFGRTLVKVTREPITAPGLTLPTHNPHRRRRMTIAVGVAACVAVGLGGLAWIATARDDVEPVQRAPSSTGTPQPPSSSADLTTVPPTSVSLLPLEQTIPQDPLGLVASGGWTLDERVPEPLQITPDKDCAALRQLAAFDGRRTIRERYYRDQRMLDLAVTFLDAGSAEGARQALDAFNQLRSCDTMTEGTDLPALRERLPDGTSVRGFRIGEEFGIIAVRGDGNLVIALELDGQGVTDRLINDLVSRAAGLLSERPAVEPLETATTPSPASVPTSGS